MMPQTIKGNGKRYPLNMRTTRDVRLKLEAAAKKSGRSMAQEVEARLERTFGDDAIIQRIDLVLKKVEGISLNMASRAFG